MKRDFKDLTIDDTDLDTELSEQAALYYFVAQKSIESEKAYKDFKAKMDQLEASLSGKAREEIRAKGDKPTEKMVADWVLLNDTFQKSQAHAGQLWAEKEVLKALKESWYMRKDLLVQVAIKQRSELESLARSTVAASTAA